MSCCRQCLCVYSIGSTVCAGLQGCALPHLPLTNARVCAVAPHRYSGKEMVPDPSGMTPAVRKVRPPPPAPSPAAYSVMFAIADHTSWA